MNTLIAVPKIALLILIWLGSAMCTYAQEASNLTLSLEELTWISYKPHDDVKRVVAHFSNKYKVDVSSMADTGMNCYVSCEQSRKMSWCLEFEHDEYDKLTGIIYSHFKPHKKGIPVVTGRGIKIGSGIEEVISRYGRIKEIVNPKFPEIFFKKFPHPSMYVDTTQPVYDYAELTYPFLLEAYSRGGELKFSARFIKGTAIKDAVVMQLKYQLFDQ